MVEIVDGTRMTRIWIGREVLIDGRARRELLMMLRKGRIRDLLVGLERLRIWVNSGMSSRLLIK